MNVCLFCPGCNIDSEILIQKYCPNDYVQIRFNDKREAILVYLSSMFISDYMLHSICYILAESSGRMVPVSSASR